MYGNFHKSCLHGHTLFTLVGKHLSGIIQKKGLSGLRVTGQIGWYFGKSTGGCCISNAFWRGGLVSAGVICCPVWVFHRVAFY